MIKWLRTYHGWLVERYERLTWLARMSDIRVVMLPWVLLAFFGTLIAKASELYRPLLILAVPVIIAGLAGTAYVNIVMWIYGARADRRRKQAAKTEAQKEG